MSVFISKVEEVLRGNLYGAQNEALLEVVGAIL